MLQSEITRAPSAVRMRRIRSPVAGTFRELITTISHDLPPLRRRDAGGRALLPQLRQRAHVCRAPRGAQVRLDPVRRRRRFDRAAPTAPIPRTFASGTSCTTTRPRAGSSARRDRREVHRRRGDGGVRRAARAVATMPSEPCEPRARSSRGSRELNERHPGIDLEVRAAVCTGEAMVALDATPGDALATGDVVNTAARLQNAAPPGGVIVGEETYRLTRHAFAFEELAADRGEGQARAGRRVARRRAARTAGQPADLAHAARRARPRAVPDPHGLGPRGAREPPAPRDGAGARPASASRGWRWRRRRRSSARAAARSGVGASRTRSRRRTGGWARSFGAPPASSRTTRSRPLAGKLAAAVDALFPRAESPRRRATCRCCSGSASTTRPTRRSTCSSRPAASSSSCRSANRSCWCSRTCTGPTTCCST